MKLLLVTLLGCSLLTASAQRKPTPAVHKTTANAKPAVAPKSNERLVEIMTTYGNLTVKLYDSTPLHRDNFIKLVQSGFYDSLLFHRIINGFMIQGGDPTSKYADSAQTVGEGAAPGDRIPAEIKPYLFHKKGVLAAARDNNPAKASSNCQFYLVQGKVLNDVELNTMECRVRGNNPAYTYTDAQRNVYKTIGGTPFLDQNYTVFGEVVSGINIIDTIAAQPRDARDRPLKPVRMQMHLLN
ncbi:peptidylprolyl isomerase [Deminuibacter soli]|uniref:peptidylprolyl isomerase n=1 Tax=Deminuibacter soli TaxID=2291815 RepID=A0A3E1NPP3_9BACT|nr:peptidylprolyl isomerase [Deminuibacter soli]RFM29880.1 peptidylprolyl isomerase [Deminuibacter soli]